MQVLGQWVVLTKTINLLPQGGLISLKICLIFGNQRKLEWEALREIMRRNSQKDRHSSRKKSNGCITLWSKVLFLTISGCTMDCTLSIEMTLLLKDVELPAEAKPVTTALGSRARVNSRQQQSVVFERHDL